MNGVGQAQFCKVRALRRRSASCIEAVAVEPELDTAKLIIRSRGLVGTKVILRRIGNGDTRIVSFRGRDEREQEVASATVHFEVRAAAERAGTKRGIGPVEID